MKGANGHRLTRVGCTVRGRGGFTLLEVMIATLILSLTAIGMFRFVQSTIRAVSYSVEDTEEQLAIERLAALVQEELHELPFRGQLTLQGEGVKLNGTDFDSMEWRSRGGPGLMNSG
jgi:prepilin-type N-terminal cleavage/methylation domain-containing protein